MDQQLASAVKAGWACHAFFLSGPDEKLCYELAGKVAMQVCAGDHGENAVAENCADYFELNGESVKIERVREIISELNHRPTGLFGRAIIIRSAQALTSQVQNALLKTIEEPPAHTVFFFTGNVEGVLPTIASRCCVMRVGLPGKDAVYARLIELGASSDIARLYAAQSGGSITRGERLYLDESYRALSESALDAFSLLLKGGLPISATKSLASDSGESLTFMLSLAADILSVKLGGQASDHPDRAEETARLAGSFTTGKLTCMIDMLSLANADIARTGRGWFYAMPAINRLFLDISEVVNK